MTSLSDKFREVELLANGSILTRIRKLPLKYGLVQVFNKLLYPVWKSGLTLKTKTFFDKDLFVTLPASTDIFLTGGKSHPSELRLTKFMLNHLRHGDCFIDVGAHVGYFTLLASEIVGPNGKVISFEPSNNIFTLLKRNTNSSANIQLYNNAVSDVEQTIEFYEFPIKYSEYNALDIDQYKGYNWFQKFKPVAIRLNAVTLDSVIEREAVSPAMIKIDVEGAEFKVLLGGGKFLNIFDGYIIMEYLLSDRGNAGHRRAVEYLLSKEYESYSIMSNGAIEKIPSVEDYMTGNRMESDNIVFKRG